MPAVLVESHGPFVWGEDVEHAVENAIALEAVAALALNTLLLAPDAAPLADGLLLRHFPRKHGAAAYYGQGREVRALRLHGAGDLRLHDEPRPGACRGRAPA